MKADPKVNEARALVRAKQAELEYANGLFKAAYWARKAAEDKLSEAKAALAAAKAEAHHEQS